MLAGPLDWLQVNTMQVVNDADVSEAVKAAYEAICYNKDKSSPFTCKYDASDIGQILWAYINYFVTNPDQNAKYYYDEYSDRKDPYRKELVATIAKTINQDADFVNKVLSYWYWSIKRKKIKRGLLRPREMDKLKNPDYWYGGQLGWAYKITQEFVAGANKVLLKVGYVVSKAAETVTGALQTAGDGLDGVKKTLGAVGGALTALPWIIGGGIVAFAGFQVWKVKTTGRIATKTDLKRMMGRE